MTQALNQFTDAGPLQEGCDMATCTDRVGGEHSVKCRVEYVSYGPCVICKRDTDALSVNVDLGDRIGVVCDTCWSRRDEDYLDERLDMTE